MSRTEKDRGGGPWVNDGTVRALRRKAERSARQTARRLLGKVPRDEIEDHEAMLDVDVPDTRHRHGAQYEAW